MDESDIDRQLVLLSDTQKYIVGAIKKRRFSSHGRQSNCVRTHITQEDSSRYVVVGHSRALEGAHPLQAVDIRKSLAVNH